VKTPSPCGRGSGRGLSAQTKPFLFLPQVQRQRHYRGGYQSAGLKSFARQQRRKQTEAESLLWQHLRKRQLRGFKFRRQHQFGDYVADFYCAEAQLVIESDGPIHTEAGRWHHDQLRDAYMTSQGLRVIRFTNEQVLNDLPSVLHEIAGYLPEKRKESSYNSSLGPLPNPLPEGEGENP